MVFETVRKNIEKYKLIEKGDIVVLGLSGGPDSVCLFSVLNNIKKEIGFEVVCVHINHMLRGKDAYEDMEYCKNICEKEDVEFYYYIKNVSEEAKKDKVSFEEKGREIRYGAFYEIADKHMKQGKNALIAVAHNYDDQAETVMMRVMRGTGPDGLAGMDFVRWNTDFRGRVQNVKETESKNRGYANNYQREEEKGHKNKYKIIRPLLNIKKEAINKYCESMKLNPRTDCTNNEQDYTRNKIRLELLPYISENFNKKIDDSLWRLSILSKCDKEYFEKETEKIISSGDEVFAEYKNSITLNRSYLRELHRAIRTRVIVGAFEKLGLTEGISYERTMACDETICRFVNGRTVEMPDDYYLYVTKDRVEFYKLKNRDKGLIEYNLNISGIKDGKEERFSLPDGLLLIKEEDAAIKDQLLQNSEASWKALIDKEKIENISVKGKICIRIRNEGDYIIPLGMKGMKKLKKVFIDDKVPLNERKVKSLICSGSEVLVILGHRISERVKLDEGTKKVLLLEYFNGI